MRSILHSREAMLKCKLALLLKTELECNKEHMQSLGGFLALKIKSNQVRENSMFRELGFI